MTLLLLFWKYGFLGFFCEYSSSSCFFSMNLFFKASSSNLLYYFCRLSFPYFSSSNYFNNFWYFYSSPFFLSVSSENFLEVSSSFFMVSREFFISSSTSVIGSIFDFRRVKNLALGFVVKSCLAKRFYFLFYFSTTYVHYISFIISSSSSS